MQTNIPVITIDGPSGSGKGTISSLLAQRLGWHFLDSGAIYRALAWSVLKHDIADDNESALAAHALNLDIQFLPREQGTAILCENTDITKAIRTEECGMSASKISAFAKVRTALLERQRAFQEVPGLVADGRDMGTIVFPEAVCKFFLIASTQVRAERRYNQLKEKGINVKLGDVLTELAARDKRDKERAVAPLVPAADAVVIDTSHLTIQRVLELVLSQIHKQSIIEL